MSDEKLDKIITLLEEMKEILEDVADALVEYEDNEKGAENLDSKVNWDKSE